MTNVIAASAALLVAALMVPAFGFEASQQPAAPQAAAPTLDYDYYKSKVQPIFVATRPGHARCIACHGSGTPLRLEPPAPGTTTFTEDASKKNFAAIQRVATAGAKSILLIHPLEESAGGDFFHSGGKHWSSQSDPEWQVLRAWVTGATK